MGSWCVVCAVSGVPIHSGDPVIGWKVRLSPFGALSSDPMFIPVSLPVIGTYDDYGGIEEVEDGESLEGDGMNVICHLEMFNEAVKQFDHKDFAGKPCESLATSWARAYERIAENINTYKKIFEAHGDKPVANKEYWERRMDPYNYAHSELNGTTTNGINFMWYLSKFILGVKGKVDTDKMSYEEREAVPWKDKVGKFEAILIEGLVNDFPVATLERLENMIKVYATAIFRCRPIMPDQMNRCVQYPDHKKEHAWVKAVRKFSASKAKTA
jgi:hypothetical protein